MPDLSQIAKTVMPDSSILSRSNCTFTKLYLLPSSYISLNLR